MTALHMYTYILYKLLRTEQCCHSRFSHSSGFQLVSTANIELENIRTDLNSKQNELTQATSDIYNLKVCNVWK